MGKRGNGMMQASKTFTEIAWEFVRYSRNSRLCIHVAHLMSVDRDTGVMITIKRTDHGLCDLCLPGSTIYSVK